MKVLITGSAGFIGSSLSIKLLEKGYKVTGIDNHNDYYDPALKEARLARHINHPNYIHIRMSIEDRLGIAKLFKDEQFDSVINLAAQAGVRYSIENPLAYIDTNLVGFANILEGCRHYKVKHLVYHVLLGHINQQQGAQVWVLVIIVQQVNIKMALAQRRVSCVVEQTNTTTQQEIAHAKRVPQVSVPTPIVKVVFRISVCVKMEAMS